MWDCNCEKTYEVGVDRGVYYVKDSSVYTNGVPWNGYRALFSRRLRGDTMDAGNWLETSYISWMSIGIRIAKNLIIMIDNI